MDILSKIIISIKSNSIKVQEQRKLGSAPRKYFAKLNVYLKIVTKWHNNKLLLYFISEEQAVIAFIHWVPYYNRLNFSALNSWLAVYPTCRFI